MILVDTSVWIDYFNGVDNPQTDLLALRKKGITIRKTADVIIATFCIEKELPLLFLDRDFIPFVDHLGLEPALRET